MFRALLVIRHFYYNLNKRLMAMAALLIVLILLLWVNLLLAQHRLQKPYNTYIPVDAVMHPIAIYRLSEPVNSDNDVKIYLTDALKHVLSIDWLNYKSQLNDAIRHYFTTRGSKSFLIEIDKAGLLDFSSLKKIWQVYSVSTPILIKKGVNSNNAYFWTLRTTVVLRKYTFSGKDSTVREATINIDAVIVRQNHLEYVNGMAIQTIYLK